MSIVAGLKAFKLQKLKIFSYEKANREEEPEVVEVMFNPDSIQKNFINEYSVPKGPEGATIEYLSTLPSSVSMKLIFDDTQVSEYAYSIALNNKHKSIKDRIDEFLTHIVKRNGAIHESQHLTICWGETLNYECRLQSLDINYTLFDRSGNPLRAELSVSFKEDDVRVAQTAKANLQSPDLTHYRMVKDGDQLPLMCENIYGSPNYYILVARANNLKDFRDLKPGQEIYFPPIEK